MGPEAIFGTLINAFDGGGDVGKSFPQSDAEDLGRGARFIPGEVTMARRAGKEISFVTSCQASSCCWYWQMPDGSRIYHFERYQFERLRDEHGSVCPECGNAHICGGTIRV
jgi:hypothetical protein